MHYVVCFHIEYFFGQALTFDDPENLGRPLIVVRNKAVLEAYFSAQTKGISPGMAERQALSIMSDARFVELSAFDFETAQSAWLDVLTDYSDVIEFAEPHIAFVDLSGHPNPGSLPHATVTRLWDEFG
ncbi:MAG: hypothetical protein KF784_00105 [Fimbriimonadaceae bacterium]|nr:hypothetical protein [Fimbriimonadaceae bacterium]